MPEKDPGGESLVEAAIDTADEHTGTRVIPDDRSADITLAPPQSSTACLRFRPSRATLGGSFIHRRRGAGACPGSWKVVRHEVVRRRAGVRFRT